MELLVRIRHRSATPESPVPGESLAGDVISVCPDCAPWSVDERTCPDWRIVRVTLTSTEGDALGMAERITDNAPRGTVGWRRRYMIDLPTLASLLPVDAQAVLANDHRPQPILDATCFLAQIRASVIQRPASY